MDSVSSLAIPIQFDSFIGRKREADEARLLLAKHRMLTITGTVGIGKTRLALQTATRMDGEFEHGIQFVDLHAVRDLQIAATTIATSLGLPTDAAQSSLGTLKEYLGDRHMLLVLDNLEQVRDASAFVSELLASGAKISVLATSRSPLHVSGEKTLALKPLAFPDPDHLPPVEELLAYDALELFVQRAQAVKADFRLSVDNARAVAQVCQSLDGIPWMIELAAARVNVLSVKQIAARLSDRFRLLGEDHYSNLSNHHTLRAAFDWSYDLLALAEKQLLCELSVFPHAFTIEDVEALYAGAGGAQTAVLDLLGGLVDKSLVMAEEYDGVMQYRLFETVRQYASEKLLAAQVGEPLDSGSQAQAKATQPTSPTGKEEGWGESVRARLTNGSGRPATEPLLRVFGIDGMRVFRGDHSVTTHEWVYAKAQEMLFYLLCNGLCTKEQIGLDLWPDASDRQLRDNFHVTIHYLRRTLGSMDWVLFENKRYTFNRALSHWFDVEAFEGHLKAAKRRLGDEGALHASQAIADLEEAVALYHDDFLAGFDGDWHLLRQEELRHDHLEALLLLGQLYLTNGRYMEAAEVYHKVLRRDNFQEIAHRQLMLCYAHRGDRAQALHHYQTLSKMLQREMGVTPAPETVALAERLRRGENF